MIERALKEIEKLIAVTKERGGTTLAIAHGQIGYYTTHLSKGHARFEDFEPTAEINNAEFVKIWSGE